jgi:hypothetical protein
LKIANSVMKRNYTRKSALVSPTLFLSQWRR